MTTDASSLGHSAEETIRISSIQPPKDGPVRASMASLGVAIDRLAATKKQYPSMPSNTSESDRLAKLLDRKIQMRLRKEKEVHRIDKELGDMMRLFRSNAGITLAAMSYKTNLPFIHLHEIEQGQRSASLLDLHTIFTQYNVNIAPIIIQAKKAH